jgi:hypothetical protein
MELSGNQINIISIPNHIHVLKRPRRNALSQSDVTDICLFSLKYQLTHPHNNGKHDISEFVELVNRFTFDGSLPMYLNTLVECMIRDTNDGDEKDVEELTITLTSLLDIMQEYKDKSGEEFHSTMSAVNLYAFLTNANGPLMVRENLWKQISMEGNNYLDEIDEDDIVITFDEDELELLRSLLDGDN